MRLAVVASLGSAAAFSINGPFAAPATFQVPAPMMMASPLAADVWTTAPAVKIQGNTLKTWNVGAESTERVQLSVKSDGRPVNTEVQLWVTPAYIPTKFSVYTEDGLLRPVDAVIETPVHPKTVAVYNRGAMEFPFDATVAKTGLGKAYDSLSDIAPEKVQGGQITSYTFGAEVESVQVLLESKVQGGRNMKAKIELTQGPNQVKQTVELYASVGYKNPFYIVIQTPGMNNAIRVINQNTVEFPFDAWVLPYETGSGSDSDPIVGGAF